jgi:UDP-N-acetyl-D-galactosamine dehydrogenase
LAVIGLGYVGLPIALEFARKIKVVGFDINQKRVDMMRRKRGPEQRARRSSTAATSTSPPIWKTCAMWSSSSWRCPRRSIEQNIPDLTPLLGATRTVGQVLKKNDYVVYESTVYPGCTEEDCVPLLERLSNLKFVEDFKVGYSPERINPGDKEHTLSSIVKVSSGCDPESCRGHRQGV